MGGDRRAMAGWVLALVAGCGNSAHVDTGEQTQRQGVLALGEVCDASSACASNVCLHLGANAQQVPGQCSQHCSTDPQCGSDGLCRPEPVAVAADGGTLDLDGGDCFKACGAASDCAPGIPCVWQEARDAGFCQTLNDTPTLCGEIAAASIESSPCVACLA